MFSARRRSFTLLALLTAVLVSCAGDPSDWPVAYDLVDGFPLAEAWSETRAVDFGTARGRRHLVSGWSGERWDRRRGEGFVHGLGSESVVAFRINWPRPIAIKLYGRPAEGTLVPSVTFEASVNGNRVGTFELSERLRRYRLDVPEGFLRAGENLLTLRYRLSEPALSAGNPGDGPSAVAAWHRLLIQDPAKLEIQEPAVLGDGASLLVPFGSRLEYTLALPSDAVFLAADVQWLGESGGRLELVLEEDDRPATRLTSVEGRAKALEVPLGGSAPRIVRLSLRAENPSARSPSRSGVIIAHPTIRAARPAEEGSRVPAVPARRGSGSERPNILLYVVDTLRADHLGVYGYSKPVSPYLDRFAADATVFDNAVAQSSWTRASMASIFTGLWPVKHAANGRKDILDPEATTLAEILREAGYVTVARVRNWNVFPVFGFRQGFEDFQAIAKGKAGRLNRLVEDWLDVRSADRPFFLYVHTVDPHGPYRPPPDFRDRFVEDGQQHLEMDRHPGFKRTRGMSEAARRAVVRHLLSLYDGEIAYNDQKFGELMTSLEERRLLDHTLVVFVSDHGEEFLDHGTWEHGRNLFAENLNVPLVIRFPDRGRGLRIPETAQHIDLLPTILDYVGISVPEWVEGSSLLPLVSRQDDGSRSAERPAYSFLHLDGLPHRSLIDGDWKLIQRLTTEGDAAWVGLFHRRDDPTDARNRALDHPIRAHYMGLLLRAKVAEGSLLTTEEAILDERTERALRALGYLQ